MNTKKIDIDYLIYILMVLLPIYKDSPLENILGGFGYSYVPICCWIFFGIYILFKQKIVINNEIIKRFTVLGIWLFLVSAIMIFIWFFGGNDLLIQGEYLPIKLIKVMLTYGAFPIYIWIIYERVVKYDIHKIFKPICFVFFLLFLICMVELATKPYAFQNLHASEVFPYYGIRLLAKEASWTTLLIYNYFMLTLYYALLCKKRKLTIVTIICELILVLVSSSKSLLILWGISIFLFAYLQRMKMSKKYFLIMCSIIVVLSLFFGLFLYPTLIKYFTSDILKFTSVSTRSYTMLMGYYLGIVYPFGVGGTLYLHFFPEVLVKYMSDFREMFPVLNMSEIYLYLRNNGEALVPKSGFGQYTMFWGIFGTSYLFSFFYKIYKLGTNASERWMSILIIAFLGNIILTLFAIDMTFEFLLLLTILYVLLIRENKILLGDN